MSNSKHDVCSVLGCLGAGLACALLLRRALRKEENIPALKLPAGSYFSLQALWKLGKDSFQYGTGRWLLQQCDPSVGICRIALLGQTNVMLRDPELVQEVLKQNHQAGGGYGKSFKGSPFDPLVDKSFGRGLFFAEDQDPQWHKAHKVLSKPFSHRGVLAMVPLICEQADKLIEALERDGLQGPVFIDDYMVKMALETIAVCSMGTRFDAFDTEAQHPFPVAFQEVLDAMFDLLNVPTQLWWLCFRTKAQIAKGTAKMNSVIDDVIQKRLRKETQSLGTSADLLDIMLEKEGSEMSQENIRSQILTFLFAGHDSTAAAMSSFVVFLMANPEVEAKLRAEIEEVVGTGDVEAGHLPQLTYLDWCLKETLRLLPPAGSYQRMSFQEDMLLGGRWKVQQYTPIIIDIFALHLDPETWGPDAALFRPERWEKGAPHAYSYMPFASGPRGCIGKEFSILEQKIVAVKLLQRFTMKCPEAWSPRKGSVLIKAADPLPQPKLGIDAEFNPLQFFVGASVPVQLSRRVSSAAFAGA